MKVGCIGVGVMGSAFARNLKAAGFEVTAYDPQTDKVAALAKHGVKMAPDLATLAAGSDFVLSSLPSDNALADVAKLLAEHARSGTCLIETSTLSLGAKEDARVRLEGAGLTALDCPVSGTGSQAEDASLVIFASGEEDAFTRCRPILNGFSRKQILVGPFGSGTKLKFVANTLIALHIASAAESLALAEAAGLDLTMVVEALTGSPASSIMFDVRAGLMANTDYRPAQMRLALWLKDLGLIEDYADEVGARHSLFGLTAEKFRETAAERPDDDTAAIFEVIRQGRSGPG